MNKYEPDYPNSFESAKDMIISFHDEAQESSDTSEYCKGMRFGARFALHVIRNFQRNLERDFVLAPKKP